MTLADDLKQEVAARAEYRQIASEIAKDCIVTDALARLLEQVVEQVLIDANKKLRLTEARIATLTDALKDVERSIIFGSKQQSLTTIHAALKGEEKTDANA